MIDINSYRRTFLRWYWAHERKEADEPGKQFPNLLSEELGRITEGEFFRFLDLDLRVREQGSYTDVQPVGLEGLVAQGMKRIALFDLIGAGKSGAARRLFHGSLLMGGEPIRLPCWLPDVRSQHGDC